MNKENDLDMRDDTSQESDKAESSNTRDTQATEEDTEERA
jgi:hypothetical protein